MLECNFVDVSSSAFILRDVNGMVIDCNNRAVERFATPREELIGGELFGPSWNPVLPDGTPFPFSQGPSQMSLLTGEAVSGVVMGIDLPSGLRCWQAVNTYPIVHDGVVKGVMSTYVDVTEAVERDHMLDLLLDVNHFVTRSTVEADSLRHLCVTLVERGHFALAWIGIARPGEEGAIDIAFASGATDYLYEGMVSWSGAKASGLGPVGTAVRTNSTQVVHDLAHQALFEPWRDRAAQFDLGSAVAIPFFPGGRRAVLAVYDSHRHAFSEMAVRGLENIAREVEFGVAHTRTTQLVAGALDGTLAALARITEERDPYTAGHQFRVGTLSEAIAVHLGLEPTLVELIRQSGEVHDVGKTAIASEILTKPGRLTELEYRMVQRHCAIGAEILSRASLPWPIAEVALQHHERMDGSGYPNGLTGNEIILPARIVAVADVIEAMMNHRPYRPEVGLEKALHEVTSRAGELYDADVVRSCLAVFDAGFLFAPTDVFDASAIP
ncbi:MAG TPA: HD domain-containing phosphohydrolase [Acidimicrobiales bacterium]|nr:HD domain-containing phosphohydrolase [Acidimicrobiales bacterium]